MRASLATTAATLALVVFAAPALAAGERGTSPPRRIAGLDPAAAPEAARASAAGGAPTIDTSALAYYLQQNNQTRAQAEIRRLRLLHPGWEPPADLASLADPSGDVQPLWQMYGAGRIDELRAEIARRIERGWQPPPELVAKLRLRETRRSLIEASDARAWATVIDLAARNPDLVTTDDLDLTWRVAEAAARTGDSRRAAELYRLILTNETRAPERLATVQKAGEVLSDADLEPLIALGNRRADGSGEFDDIRLDRLRRRIGVALGGERSSGPPRPSWRRSRRRRAGAAARAMPR
ncbi:hypothetical protein [Methyloraptor flagellatus]|uniref:Tetratricopeptide repeat protein n=1 Tax=Methyloraptor flagellatus TaxID=3162530 RepID=A0AAU7X5T2_9HYPH